MEIGQPSILGIIDSEEAQQFDVGYVCRGGGGSFPKSTAIGN